MRIGISVTSAFDVADVRVGARYMIEQARAARDAKLDSLFVGDHHVTPRPYYQNSPILGRLLAEWGDGPAGALYLLPLWNPVLVAEQTATLACINRGRFVMQCGIGGDERQSSGMGVDIRLRPSMFEESLETIRALWRGESVTVDGRWRLHKSRIAPLPPEPIEVWIGASAKVAIDRAARLGDAWLADPGMDFETARRRIDEYREACVRHNRTPTTIAIRRDTHVGASPDDARRAMARYLRSGYRGFSEDALLIGDVERVAARMAELGAMGYTDVIIRNISAEQPEALATIERLAQVRERVSANLMPIDSRVWLARAQRLRAIAQIGQTYTENRYDRERFDELASIANEMLADLTGAPLETIVGIYLPERGYPTPKVDVRAGVFNDAGHVLLVREASDGRWALPGGWADEHDSPKVACEREVVEESGYLATAIKLAAIKDRSMHPYVPHRLERIYKLLFVCSLDGGTAATSIETTAATFFPLDALPDLSIGRTLPADIELLWEHRCQPELVCYFD